MTNKILQIRNIAGVSLLSFVMMFATAAPSMNTAYGGPGFDANEFCSTNFGAFAPNGVGSSDFTTFIAVKCFDASLPCFNPGVPLKATDPTPCVFVVVGLGAGEIILADAVNAEWEVTGHIDPAGTCDDPAPANGKDNGKSATLIHCSGGTSHVILIEVETRPSPGGGHKDPITKERITVFKPTSCDLSLNEGAQVIEALNGEPVLVDDGQGIGILVPNVLGESPPLPVPVDDESCLD